MKRLILAALGYAAYRWWQNQPTSDTETPARPGPVRRKPMPTPDAAE